MTRKKKIESKELDNTHSADTLINLDKVEDTTVELLKELIKVNKEIKDILTRLKDRFI